MVFVRSIKVAPVSSNFLLKELDLSPHRKVAGFFFTSRQVPQRLRYSRADANEVVPPRTYAAPQND